MSIQTECMVIGLRVGVWLGYKLDRAKSDEITQAAKAAIGSAHVNKHLLPKEVTSPVTAASAAVRHHLYALTWPWKDNGERLLPRKTYTKFIERHEALVNDFHAAVNNLLTKDYPQTVARAAFRMGDMFRPEDYPAAEELRRKFYIDLTIEPVADAADFRVDIGRDEIVRIQESLTDTIAQRVEAARAEMWHRLDTALRTYTERVSTAGVFRNSSVTNLTELVDLLPDMNFVGDSDFDAFVERVRNDVAAFGPDDLRKVEGAKDSALGEAKAIIADMAPFMNAFGCNPED